METDLAGHLASLRIKWRVNGISKKQVVFIGDESLCGRPSSLRGSATTSDLNSTEFMTENSSFKTILANPSAL